MLLFLCAHIEASAFHQVHHRLRHTVEANTLIFVVNGTNAVNSFVHALDNLSKHGLSFLKVTSLCRTCFLYPGSLSHPCVPFAVLLFQSIRQSILCFTDIQCCPALNGRFRFRSVVLNLCHRISYCTFHWDKFEFTKLAHLLSLRFNKIQPVLGQISKFPTNRSSPCCVIQNQTLFSV